MIYLELFLVFLKIGAIAFGGGYAMIPLIREEVLLRGWLNEERFMDLIAVAESTPGPIAVNMATFVGSTQGGLLGALLATLGVVLPSFVIILILAALLKTLLKKKAAQGVLAGIRPAIVAMILATGVTMFLSVIFSFSSVGKGFAFDLSALLILGILVAVRGITLFFKVKKLSPILVILLSAGLGILFYGVF